MLSIFSTFREALFLALKNFWFLVIIDLVTDAPVVWRTMPIPPSTSPSGSEQLTSFLLLFCTTLLAAVNTAAILSLLKNSGEEKNVWKGIWRSVAAYTWTLFRLSILLAGIAFLLVIPCGALILLFGPVKIISLLLGVIYLVFAKYALANPLVVLENFRARAALRKSWEMTRGHFWYVAGCYLFLGGGIELIGWGLNSPLQGSQNSITGISVMTDYCCALASSLWVILAWCMYQRIRQAEPAPQPPSSPTQSPPESPCAARSA